MILARRTAAALLLVISGTSYCNPKSNMVAVVNRTGEPILITVEGTPVIDREVGASHQTEFFVDEDSDCLQGPTIVEGAESGQRADLGTLCGGDTVAVLAETFEDATD